MSYTHKHIYDEYFDETLLQLINNIETNIHETGASLETRTVENIILKYENRGIFKGGGCIRRIKVKVNVKDGAIPFSCPARRIPIAIHEQVESQLEKMCDEGSRGVRH